VENPEVPAGGFHTDDADPALACRGTVRVDYRAFVILGTVGVLIQLTCTFAGIGVILDRTSGARREPLAAPVPRALIIAGQPHHRLLTGALQVVG
jgi:hypothetical protein